MQRTRPTIQRKQRIPASLILRHVDKPGQQCDSKQVQVINSVKKWASVNIPTTSEQAMSVGTSNSPDVLHVGRSITRDSTIRT